MRSRPQDTNIRTMQDFNTPEFEAMAREILADAATYAEVTALNFFKESFNQQGWLGSSFEAWPERKAGADGRGVLIKTGHLRDSIRVLESSPLRIVFGTNAPYAQIHNEGGTVSIRITPKARRYFWAMYKTTEKAFWKAMALKKDNITIKVPKRQFLGESQTLLRQLDTWVSNRIQQRFKQL